jgi:peptidoglycan/xylan/chitin deacetylase (PgdA/CDA1 family)
VRGLAGRTLKAARRAVAARLRGAVVLVYHRVTELELDPQLLAVRPEHFRAQMDLVSAEYTPMALGELLSAASANRLPERAVAVTFDDGYADNLQLAEPILRALGVPATVFVATGYCTAQNEYWWDELERILLVGSQGPEVLELSDGTESRSYATLSAAERSDAYDALQPWLRSGSVERREGLLRQLRRWAGEPEGPVCRESHRPMTVEEVRALDRSSVVELAAHTRRHPCLAQESPDVQREEIEGSAADLTDWLGASPSSFAYPFGGPLIDYTGETRRFVREAGFELAASTVPEQVTRLSSRWEVPRRLVRDWGSQQFESWLAGYFSRH